MEYACKAVENSGLAAAHYFFSILLEYRTAIGIKCRDGIVLGIEKVIEQYAQY